MTGEVRIKITQPIRQMNKAKVKIVKCKKKTTASTKCLNLKINRKITKHFKE